MKINFFSKLFGALRSKANSKNSAKSKQKLAQKAEQMLQSRLVGNDLLMKSIYTGDYLMFTTGKKFTGKFAIRTPKIEQILHIINGKIRGKLTRKTDGSKISAEFHNHKKDFVIPDKKTVSQLAKLKTARDFAHSDLVYNYVLYKEEEADGLYRRLSF